MKYLIALLFAFALSGSAAAQHAHGSQKGPNGGQLQDVAGVEAELVTSGNIITINVFDEGNKPLSTKGFAGSALIINGAERETLTLSPSGESALVGKAKKPIGTSATIAITLKTSAGRSGQARFKP